MRLGTDLNQARFVESGRWPVAYGGLAGLRGFEVRASFSGQRLSEFRINCVLISTCSCGKRIFKRFASCVKCGMRVRVWCRGGPWGRGAGATSSGCLSRGSRGHNCRVLCVMYVYFKELCISIGFGLHGRCARDVARSRACVGLVRPYGCGPGEA